MKRPYVHSHPRGNAFVDYLMMTAVVAGIMVPIVNRFFGQAIMDSLFANRQRLVDFIAQTPKRPVPNLWFAIERQGEVGGNGDVGGGGNLGEVGDVGGGGNLGEVGDVGGGGQLNNPRAVGGNGKLGNVGNVGGGGALGNVGGSRGGGGAGGGAGGGLGSESALNDNFLSPAEKGSTTAEGDSASGGTQKNYGRGASGPGESGSGDSGGRDSAGNTKTAKAPGDGGDSSKVDGGVESRKSQNLTIAQVEENERAKARAFDWWLLVKILIVLLILFLLILIALSNLKRT